MSLHETIAHLSPITSKIARIEYVSIWIMSANNVCSIYHTIFECNSLFLSKRFTTNEDPKGYAQILL